jgi:hypothetical protein
LCPECGFPIDPANESQAVCPACGADPTVPPDADDGLAGALEDAAAFAETPLVLAEDSPTEPEIDYLPDPELGQAIADAEGLMQSLAEAPILVAGNDLIN